MENTFAPVQSFEVVGTSFRVVSVSSNLNSFGLRGHIMISRSGVAYEAVRSDFGGNPRLKNGDDVRIPTTVLIEGEGEERVEVSREYNFGSQSFELPRRLEAPPAEVLRAVFGS